MDAAGAPGRAGDGTPAERLRAASVLVVGVGALGCAAAESLARAGVGRLMLVDPDRVERSNLHRQLLHRTADLGRPKVASAAATLAARHPGLAIQVEACALDAANAPAILAGHACAVDATDGIATKFLVNDVAVGARLPFVHAGILRFQGQLMTVVPGVTACYRCLFGRPPTVGDAPSCQEAGVIGALAGTIGALQAAEAVRLAAGLGSGLRDLLLTYDALACRWRRVRLRRHPGCGACAPLGR